MSSEYVDRRKDWIRSRRNRRKQARSARLNRQVFRYILLLGLLWGGGQTLMRLPWLLANPETDIVVHGNHVVTTEQVRKSLGDMTDAKVFQLDPRKLERKVEALKAVKYAFVRRCALPKPVVTVEVLEEFPWATFSTAPDAPPTAVISQSGRMIPLSEFPRIARPPLTIYGAPSLKLNSRLVAQWASWAAFISTQTGQPVQSVDLRKPYEVCVQNGELYLKLGAADGTLTTRLGRLSSILASIEPLKSRLEYIDLGLDNNVPLKLAKRPIEGRQNQETIEHLQQAQVPAARAM